MARSTQLGRLVERRRHEREQEVLLLAEMVTALPVDEAHERLRRRQPLLLRDRPAQRACDHQAVVVAVGERYQRGMAAHPPHGRTQAGLAGHEIWGVHPRAGHAPCG